MRFFFCLVLFIIGSATQFSYAQNCNLPAPTNLAKVFSATGTVSFTWDSMPGAWGYRASLQEVGATVGQIVVTTSPQASFSINPNTKYIFMVGGACSEIIFSYHVTTQEFISPDYLIVAEVILELASPCAGPSVWSKKTIDKGIVYSSPKPIKVGTEYNVEFKYGVSAALQVVKAKIFRYTSTRFKFWRLNTNTPQWGILGQIPETNVCSNCYQWGVLRHPIDESTQIKFTLNPDGYLHFSAEGIKNFSDFKLTECTIGGEGAQPLQNRIVNSHPGAEDHHTHPVYEAMTVSPNPFTNELRINFDISPSLPVTAQIFDISGCLQVETIIMPDDISDHNYVIPTDHLSAGLYFLHLNAQPGKLQTMKVVKM